MENKKVLTQRQKQLLDCITKYLHEKGYPPSQREMAKEMNCSLRPLQEILECLIEKGMIAQDHGVTRGLRIVGTHNKAA